MVNYDVDRHTRLYVHHGPVGIAATVAQQYVDEATGDVVYRPVHHNSRVLTPTEERYGKVEGESLALLSGIKSNRMYLYGTSFEVVVDHKPLVPLYNTPSRPSPIRVDRHKSKLLAFDFKVVYEPGHRNPCDYGSRHPDKIPGYEKMTTAQKEDLGIEDKDEDSTFSVNRVVSENILGAVTRETLVRETEADGDLSQVVKDVVRGRLSEQVKKTPYGKIYEELTVCGGALISSLPNIIL